MDKKNLIDDEENTNKKPSLIYENQIDILDL